MRSTSNVVPEKYKIALLAKLSPIIQLTTGTGVEILRYVNHRPLFSVVTIDSNVPSSDLHTDKSLMEGDTEALREIDDGICAVGSDSCYEN